MQGRPVGIHASTSWVKNAPSIRFFDATRPAKVGVVVAQTGRVLKGVHAGASCRHPCLHLVGKKCSKYSLF
jgi:hypothetical protein